MMFFVLYIATLFKEPERGIFEDEPKPRTFTTKSLLIFICESGGGGGGVLNTPQTLHPYQPFMEQFNCGRCVRPRSLVGFSQSDLLLKRTQINTGRTTKNGANLIGSYKGR